MASQQPMTNATSASGVTTDSQPVDLGSTLEELRRMTSAQREEHGMDMTYEPYYLGRRWFYPIPPPSHKDFEARYYAWRKSLTSSTVYRPEFPGLLF